MVKMAKESGFDVVEPSMELKWVPTAEELKKCFEFGQHDRPKNQGLTFLFFFIVIRATASCLLSSRKK